MDNSDFLSIRGDVFEHGTYPTPPKLTLNLLYNIINSLSNLATDNKISIENFKDIITKSLPPLSIQDAEIYFITIKILADEDSSFLFNLSKKNNVFIDIRTLSVFLFLQLFHLTQRASYQNSKDFQAFALNSQFFESIRANSV